MPGHTRLRATMQRGRTFSPHRLESKAFGTLVDLCVSSRHLCCMHFSIYACHHDTCAGCRSRVSLGLQSVIILDIIGNCFGRRCVVKWLLGCSVPNKLRTLEGSFRVWNYRDTMIKKKHPSSNVRPASQVIAKPNCFIFHTFKDGSNMFQQTMGGTNIRE